jgi:predicted ATPase
MMPEQQRHENHMRFGLCHCIQTLDDSFDNDELFFVAVNQINQGGSAAVHEPSQKSIVAELNLKAAGRHSIQLSDYNTAVKFFQHGISFLGDEKWTSNYQLSLDLYDAVTDGAFILGQIDMVKLHSDEVLLHARCFDDKLHSECIASHCFPIDFSFILPNS